MAWAPGMQILGEDVIWSGDEDDGFLSSHRSVIVCPHVNDGPLGTATGKTLWQYCIADCACRDNVIYDEWLVHDIGGLYAAAGHRARRPMPKAAIAREGGPDNCRSRSRRSTMCRPLTRAAATITRWASAMPIS